MKKFLPISLVTVATLSVAGFLFAQSTTALTIVEKMKAASHDFILASELNAGQTDLKSGPISGKKTGGIVTAEEYNRILEILNEKGGSGGATGSVSTNIFGVRLASNYTSSEKVAVTVHWDTEDFDTDNQFDMTNHYFKPSQAGYYFLTANVCFDDLDYSNGNGPDQIWAFISKNGAGIGNTSNASSSSIIFGTNNVTFSGLSDPCVHVSGIMQSDGDDYFSVAAFQDDKSATPVKAGSNFYGFRINGGGTGGTGGGSTGGNGGISYTYYCFNNITRNSIGYYGTPHCPSTTLKVGDPCPDDSSYTIKKILGSWGHCDGDFVWGDTGHFLPPGGTCTYSGISDSTIGSAYLCAQEGGGNSVGGSISCHVSCGAQNNTANTWSEWSPVVNATKIVGLFCQADKTGWYGGPDYSGHSIYYNHASYMENEVNDDVSRIRCMIGNTNSGSRACVRYCD